MDALDRDRELIECLLLEYTELPFAYGEIASEAIFDHHRDRYLVMMIGWDGPRRIHEPLLHVDLQGGKFWIQHDGTEEGIARRLVEAGVPKERIVLAWRPAEVRKYGEYAVA
jgi:hypothetical protein